MTVERVEDEGCFLSFADILQSCSNSCLQSTENIDLCSSVNIVGGRKGEVSYHLVGGRKGEDSYHLVGGRKGEDSNHLVGGRKGEDSYHLVGGRKGEDSNHLVGGRKGEDSYHLVGGRKGEDSYHLIPVRPPPLRGRLPRKSLISHIHPFLPPNKIFFSRFWGSLPSTFKIFRPWKKSNTIKSWPTSWSQISISGNSPFGTPALKKNAERYEW